MILLGPVGHGMTAGPLGLWCRGSAVPGGKGGPVAGISRTPAARACLPLPNTLAALLPFPRPRLTLHRRRLHETHTALPSSDGVPAAHQGTCRCGNGSLPGRLRHLLWRSCLFFPMPYLLWSLLTAATNRARATLSAFIISPLRSFTPHTFTRPPGSFQQTAYSCLTRSIKHAVRWWCGYIKLHTSHLTYLPILLQHALPSLVPSRMAFSFSPGHVGFPHQWPGTLCLSFPHHFCTLSCMHCAHTFPFPCYLPALSLLPHTSCYAHGEAPHSTPPYSGHDQEALPANFPSFRRIRQTTALTPLVWHVRKPTILYSLRSYGL